jgi:hypothetical protein
LRGDLDNIVLKALEPEPQRRYPSAGALADDIERFLDHQPVSAHPPSRLYRAKKFFQRHRAGVLTSALFLVGIFAALAVALWQANVARQEAVRANTVRDFIVTVFDAARAHLPREQRPTPEALVEQAQRQLAGGDEPRRRDARRRAAHARRSQSVAVEFCPRRSDVRGSPRSGDRAAAIRLPPAARACCAPTRCSAPGAMPRRCASCTRNSMICADRRRRRCCAHLSVLAAAELATGRRMRRSRTGAKPQRPRIASTARTASKLWPARSTSATRFPKWNGSPRP